MVIAVFFTAMVAVLFSTLTGCRGCSSEEKEVAHWVPAPRDITPEVVVEDSEPVVVEEIVVAAEPAKNAEPAKKKYSVSKYKYDESAYQDEDENICIGNCNQQHNRTIIIRSWPEELNVDSIRLTIATSDLEIQITQNFN
ncbi:MAG: hypothetical protein LBU44_01675 [Mediterranea sp.]|nr:hypothetical protein [Mediterranea sp.]